MDPARPAYTMRVVSRVPHAAHAVALETTLLLHGVPKSESPALAADLAGIVRTHGAHPAIVGVVGGVPTVGLSDAELAVLLAADKVPKVNTSNLGVAIHRKTHAATSVSTTMELAAAAGVHVFATGGLGGVHTNLAAHLDVSADLAAFARFPVAVVTSGVKSLLDVEGTREILETLGVPVVGYRTDRFPAFYLRESAATVDARFDDHADLARFVAAEMSRTGRGVVVCNPIPAVDEIPPDDWRAWLVAAEAMVGSTTGRDATPRLLAALHEVSRGATLRANLSLVRSNADLAARLAGFLV
jgi:pseudouridine-5'-phosphate glycosidase